MMFFITHIHMLVTTFSCSKEFREFYMNMVYWTKTVSTRTVTRFMQSFLKKKRKICLLFVHVYICDYQFCISGILTLWRGLEQRLLLKLGLLAFLTFLLHALRYAMIQKKILSLITYLWNNHHKILIIV